MSSDVALFLYGLTFAVELGLWLLRKLRPDYGPVFA